MIKQLILLVQVLGLFFYQLIFSGDITVNQKVSKTIIQGKESIVEVFINKADVTGFAKVQQVIPDGFSVDLIETKGATFSFKDNKVKFIWMSLPSEEEFTVSYKLIPDNNVVGDFTLEGKFSFIADNERKNIEIPPVSFSVLSEGIEEEQLADNNIVSKEDVSVTAPVLVSPPVDEIIENPSKISVNCTRTIKSIDENKFKVTLEVKKIGVEGFAKVSEILPQGFIASELESKGGVFSFKGKEVKILWMAVPGDDSYTVNYIIEPTASAQKGTQEIVGQYYYLDQDISSKSNIEKATFYYEPNELVEEEVVEVIEQPTSTPNPEHGVTYKVQVGAGHKSVSSFYFKKKFNLKESVSTINHQGWIKYLVGSFDEYKQARDKRESVRDNIQTAFVTAYNSGDRITVQEALMISRQKWYK
jgi:hypothetical protein